MRRRQDPNFSWKKWGQNNITSACQYAIFYAVSRKPGQCIKIDRLYALIEAETADAARKRRGVKYPQQRLGSFISRINPKLRAMGYIIKPGDIKQTYIMRRLLPGE